MLEKFRNYLSVFTLGLGVSMAIFAFIIMPDYEEKNKVEKQEIAQEFYDKGYNEAYELYQKAINEEIEKAYEKGYSKGYDEKGLINCVADWFN